MTEERFKRIEQRMDTVEKYQHLAEVRDARAEERAIAQAKWMESMDKSVADQKQNGTWLVRIAGAAVVGAIIKFMLEGGLTNVAG